MLFINEKQGKNIKAEMQTIYVYYPGLAKNF